MGVHAWVDGDGEGGGQGQVVGKAQFWRCVDLVKPQL